MAMKESKAKENNKIKKKTVNLGNVLVLVWRNEKKNVCINFVWNAILIYFCH